MNNLAISFGKKIPMYQCKIYDRKTSEYSDATIYEYDCKNHSDAREIEKEEKDWKFANALVIWMKHKIRNPEEHKRYRYFSLENQDQEILGLMQTKKEDGNFNVELLESKEDTGYKYVGSSLLSAISQISLDNEANYLTIDYPLEDARSYYIEKCGFSPVTGMLLALDKSGMKDLIKKTEQNTHGKFLDINC